MAPDARGILRLLVLSFFAFTYVTSGSSPTVITLPKVTTLYQYETSSVNLSTVTCKDPDNGQCNVSLSLLYPSNPCGDCFSILPCGGTTEYCVMYSPGLGHFNLSVESQYLLTVTATNDQLESDPVQSIVDVRIIPNSRPVFATYPVMTDSLTVPNAKATGSGVTLYNVAVNDPEGDPLTFTMTTEPETDSLGIDPVSGTIRTTKSLRSECRSNIVALVFVQDSVNTGMQVGPFVVNIKLINANSAPIITNLNSEIRVRENEPLNTPVMTLAMFDDDTAVTYTVSTSPASAANLFQIVPTATVTELQVKSALDFETQPQTITMTIEASDGYCTSETYNLTVTLVDINEPPTLGPEHQTFESCEGKVNIVPNWIATDVDAHDNGLLRYVSLGPDTDGRFTINEQTGVVSTLVDYDVDQNSMPPTVTLVTTLSDVQGLSATATITVRFIDCNDNAPIFSSKTYAFQAEDCDPPGFILGTVRAADLDSEYEQNNVITFSGSAPGIMVQPGGAVVTTSTMAAGTVVTMKVYATDRGRTPGPLTSKSPAYVSVNVIKCTTLSSSLAPLTVTTTLAVTTLANVADFLDVNMGWIVAAALIGALLRV